MGGCIAKPPREMRSESGEPMGNGFGGARERAAAILPLNTLRLQSLQLNGLGGRRW